MHETSTPAPARGALYDFEGKRLTVAQIQSLVPALSASTVRMHLRAGRTSRQAMLAFDPACARARGGRNAAAVAKSRAAAAEDGRQC